MIGAKDAHFDPCAFAVRDFEHAMHATVGDLEFNDGTRITCEDRWGPETVYTVSLIRDLLPIESSSYVLDYGCGTGRIAKGLIETCGCSVDGVDESCSMLNVARRYVVDERFQVLAPRELSQGRSAVFLNPREIGLNEAEVPLSLATYDFAVCIFVLQHSFDPRQDILRLYRALKPSGRLLVVNENRRYVPTLEFGFSNDGVDVPACLAEAFGPPITSDKLDPAVVSPKFSERSFWAVYQRPPGP